MRKFSDLIKENSSAEDWMSKFEQEHDVKDAAKHIVSASLDSMMYDSQLTLRDIEQFRNDLMEGIQVDATNVLEFSLEKEIDLCTYAEEIDQDKCPETSFDHLRMVISQRAVDGLRYISNKFAEKFCSKLDDLTDAYDMHDFKLSSRDPYEMFPPESVDVKGRFSLTKYRNLEGESDSNYDVYHFGEEDYPNFYLISKI